MIDVSIYDANLKEAIIWDVESSSTPILGCTSPDSSFAQRFVAKIIPRSGGVIASLNKNIKFRISAALSKLILQDAQDSDDLPHNSTIAEK